jgi:competence protein ComEC
MKTITLEKVLGFLMGIFKYTFWIVISFVYILSVKHTDTVVFLNVGQGDATFIQNGDIQVLIDGGPDISILYEIQKYMPFYDRSIEYLILTHPHEDHLLGLMHILERYEVGEILYYPVCYKNKNYEYFLSNYDNLREVSNGYIIGLYSTSLKVIWPRVEGPKTGNCYKSWNGNINNDSIVLEFEYLDKKILLMGDAEKEVENILISEGKIHSKVDILKAGHHCSNTSSGETFLLLSNPSLVICSCGYGNKFKHPGSETLNNFRSINVHYLVTHEEGNIRIK